MASKMMLGLLTVICIIDFMLLFKQTNSLTDQDMEIKALVEINQNSIESATNMLTKHQDNSKKQKEQTEELHEQIQRLSARVASLERYIRDNNKTM